jgi:hypothetical protein
VLWYCNDLSLFGTLSKIRALPQWWEKENKQAKYSGERDFYCESKEAFSKSDRTPLKRCGVKQQWYSLRHEISSSGKGPTAPRCCGLGLLFSVRAEKSCWCQLLGPPLTLPNKPRQGPMLSSCGVL